MLLPNRRGSDLPLHLHWFFSKNERGVLLQDSKSLIEDVSSSLLPLVHKNEGIMKGEESIEPVWEWFRVRRRRGKNEEPQAWDRRRILLSRSQLGVTGATVQLYDTKAAMEEIDAMISMIVGLDGVKLQLRKWIKGLVMFEKRKSLGLKVGKRKPLHMAFLGNPGTGKTMIARLLGKILHKVGLLSTDKVVEVQRTDLVAEYIGQTGPKTRSKIQEAGGGILFVDEAYRLMLPDPTRDFGCEALEEIMSAMDNGDIVTIFAGYSHEMERVISANAGFSRRVSKTFHFDDYSSRDIAAILQSKFCSQKEDSFIYGFKLHPHCTVMAIAKLIIEHTTEEQLKKLNGGLVDPLLVNTLENMDLRLDLECTDADILTTITLEDLEEGLKSLSGCKKKPCRGSHPKKRAKTRVSRDLSKCHRQDCNGVKTRRS